MRQENDEGEHEMKVFRCERGIAIYVNKLET